MSFLLFVSFFVLGTIIGSFLNVVVLRYGAQGLGGRSKCFSCGKVLRWFELLPLFSFLVQGGRCRGCKGGISLQYPLVEFVTGLVFLGVAWKESSLLFSSSSPLSLPSTLYLLLTLFLWSLLIAISVYDVRHKIIPDKILYGALTVAFLLFALRFTTGNVSHVWLEALGGLFFAVPFALLWFFSHGRAMGLGDAKLMLLFSWLLGFAKGLSALIVGFWVGAVVACVALLLKALVFGMPIGLFSNLKSKLKNLGPKTELPLGPFLVFGLLLVYLFGWDVTGLSLLLQSNEL